MCCPSPGGLLACPLTKQGSQSLLQNEAGMSDHAKVLVSSAVAAQNKGRGAELLADGKTARLDDYQAMSI
jgi:hypothetical protein